MDKEVTDILFGIKNEIKSINDRLNSIERLIETDKKSLLENQCINKSVEDRGELIKFFDEVYKNVNDEIKYKTWIQPNVTGTIIKDDTIIIRCSNSFNCDILKSKYYDLFKRSTKYKVVIEEVK